jgi:hypothetical protein
MDLDRSKKVLCRSNCPQNAYLWISPYAHTHMACLATHHASFVACPAFVVFTDVTTIQRLAARVCSKNRKGHEKYFSLALQPEASTFQKENISFHVTYIIECFLAPLRITW